jgi:hypothetical protein
MFDELLQQAAARCAVGWISGEELKAIADNALNRGIYSYSLGELATLINPILSEAGPLFESALEELCIPIPPKRNAIMAVAASCMRGILEGTVNPEVGLSEFHNLAIHDLHRAPFMDAAVRSSIEEVAYLYYDYDYYGSGVFPLAEVDRGVLERVAVWNQNHNRCLVNSAWLTWNNATVPAIAQRICDERTFHDLPILADALEEAGCTDADILAHCRGGGEHVRGCWVVDSILGKN